MYLQFTQMHIYALTKQIYQLFSSAFARYVPKYFTIRMICQPCYILHFPNICSDDVDKNPFV